MWHISPIAGVAHFMGAWVAKLQGDACIAHFPKCQCGTLHCPGTLTKNGSGEDVDEQSK